VRDYEARLGIRLLEQGRHGRTGAHLTDEGNEIVDRFHKILDKMDAVVSDGAMMEFIGEIEHLKGAS
jgi:DNA-binding transcriptional LysR family regulator